MRLGTVIFLNKGLSLEGELLRRRHIDARGMTKASTVRAIYKCLLQDATDLQRTPQFRLRNALRVEQWGHGHYVHPRNAHSIAYDTEPSRIRSLKEYYEAQERGFRYEDQFESIPDIVRQSFKANVGETDPILIAAKLDDAVRYGILMVMGDWQSKG